MLIMRDVVASYGAVQALFGVSLHMDEGQVLALMGRNGMGKTTTLRALMRMMPSGGEIRFQCRDLTRLPAQMAARAGLGLVPEGRRCFAPLSVRENLIVAARPGEWSMARVTELFPRLDERMSQRAGTLSGGEQQMLAIGRALMTNPRLLILDEATEGLAPVVRAEIRAAITRLKAQGMSILIVDKALSELREIADRAVILERGRDVWSGPITDLDAATAARYLGI